MTPVQAIHQAALGGSLACSAHNHAFRVLGGVPRRGIYNNMKTAIDKVGRGKQRQVNIRFSAMVSHFLFEAEFSQPGLGRSLSGSLSGKAVQGDRRRVGEGAGREERAGCPSPALAAHAELSLA